MIGKLSRDTIMGNTLLVLSQEVFIYNYKRFVKIYFFESTSNYNNCYHNKPLSIIKHENVKLGSIKCLHMLPCIVTIQQWDVEYT